MGLILLSGGEAVLAERAISDFIAARPEAEVNSLDASEIEVGAITDALSPSLFGGDRIVVLKDLQDLDSDCADELLAYIESPEEDVDLLLWHKGGVKGKAVLDKIKKAKPTIIDCETIKKDGDKADFVRQEFKRLGRKVSTDAVQALIDALGSDLRELNSAISQLSSDVIAGKMIDAEDVDKYQQGRVETSGFDVADAAMERKQAAALIALRNALDTGTDPVMIVSALASNLRAVGKVSGISRGVRSYDVAGELGMAPWQIDKARRTLAHWTPETLTRAVIAVAQADADIKGAAADPIHALERAIIAMTS
jgi:DNA polymerase III subunit delta